MIKNTNLKEFIKYYENKFKNNNEKKKMKLSIVIFMIVHKNTKYFIIIVLVPNYLDYFFSFCYFLNLKIVLKIFYFLIYKFY